MENRGNKSQYFEKAVPPEEKVTKQDLQAMIDQLETLKNRIIE